MGHGLRLRCPGHAFESIPQNGAQGVVFGGLESLGPPAGHRLEQPEPGPSRTILRGRFPPGGVEILQGRDDALEPGAGLGELPGGILPLGLGPDRGVGLKDESCPDDRQGQGRRQGGQPREPAQRPAVGRSRRHQPEPGLDDDLDESHDEKDKRQRQPRRPWPGTRQIQQSPLSGQTENSREYRNPDVQPGHQRPPT